VPDTHAERIGALDRLAESAPEGRTRAFAEALSASREADSELRAASADALAATGDPGPCIGALRALAADEVPGVRFRATAALAGTPWRGRLDALAAMLADADARVAMLAAEGLSHAGDARAAPVLRAALADRRTRFQALEGLLALGDDGLPETARRVFGAFFATPFERALAAVVLARGGDAKARAHLLRRASKRRAEERPFVVVYLATADPGEGRALVEAIARDEHDYLRESALLALVKLDRSWWSKAQESIARYADDDPHVAAELLLGLSDVDAERAGLALEARVDRADELGAAARRLRLALHLRRAFPREVLLRCG